MYSVVRDSSVISQTRSQSRQCVMTQCTVLVFRGVRLAKKDFGSVFGSVWQKIAVFGSVLVFR